MKGKKMHLRTADSSLMVVMYRRVEGMSPKAQKSTASGTVSPLDDMSGIDHTTIRLTDQRGGQKAMLNSLMHWLKKSYLIHLFEGYYTISVHGLI